MVSFVQNVKTTLLNNETFKCLDFGMFPNMRNIIIVRTPNRSTECLFRNKASESLSKILPIGKQESKINLL